MADLREWNDLSQSDVLSIGQEVIIYPSSSSADTETSPTATVEPKFEVYKVKAGDTLYQIAREHQATIKQLMEWNGKTDFNLSIGEELKVAKQP